MSLPLSHYQNLAPFVQDIIVLEDIDAQGLQEFPFYADGFAGIIYTQSKKPFFLQPANKQLSELYFAGQTLKPITLAVEGPYKLIGLRLYSCAIKVLLNINPKTLNDDCYDLKQLTHIDTNLTLEKLQGISDTSSILLILENYFAELLKHAAVNPDNRVILATSLILKSQGQITVKEVRERLCVSERTMERLFLKEMGITTKQFAKVIQFSSSLNQLADADYNKLTDIGYQNGFADQSHFIRNFKKFTGKTPKEFQKQLAS